MTPARAGRHGLRMVEQCPACHGEPSTMTWFCGDAGCDTSEAICLFCDGAGVVIAGPAGWVEIGDRIRWARYDADTWWGYDGDRLVWTIDEKRRQPGPVPLELEAHHHRIPAEMLDAIEHGVMDPRAIASTVRRLRERPKQRLLL